MLDNVGTGDVCSLVDVIELASKSSYDEATTGLTDYCYIEGDFSDSFDFLSGLEDTKYKLLSYNCSQVSFLHFHMVI